MDGRTIEVEFPKVGGTLRFALATDALAPRVVQLKPQHVNVDFGDAGPGASPDASPRASDHDPVLLLLSRP